jgi:hypothetical protein
MRLRSPTKAFRDKFCLPFVKLQLSRVTLYSVINQFIVELEAAVRAKCRT